jgi:hypothetical protein
VVVLLYIQQERTLLYLASRDCRREEGNEERLGKEEHREIQARQREVGIAYKNREAWSNTYLT